MLLVCLLVSSSFVCSVLSSESHATPKFRTWSGGHAGITLNATAELTIYEAKVRAPESSPRSIFIPLMLQPAIWL